MAAWLFVLIDDIIIISIVEVHSQRVSNGNEKLLI